MTPTPMTPQDDSRLTLRNPAPCARSSWPRLTPYPQGDLACRSPPHGGPDGQITLFARGTVFQSPAGQMRAAEYSSLLTILSKLSRAGPRLERNRHSAACVSASSESAPPAG